MSTWGEIRNWTVERMAEYQAGAAEADGAATMVNATIYRRITDAFRQLLAEAFIAKPTKVGQRVSFAYAANSESVVLPAAAKWRPIAKVDQLLGDGVTYEALTQLSDDQMSRAALAMDTTYGFRIENDSIWVSPKPSGALTLRALYLPEHAAITVADAANSPNYIPAEHHMLIAMRAAISFLSETSRSSSLSTELAKREGDFISWAKKDPQAGPTYVREYD